MCCASLYACVCFVCVGDRVKLLYCEAVPSEVGVYHVINLRTKEEGKVPLDTVDFIDGEPLHVCACMSVWMHYCLLWHMHVL